MEAHHHDMAQPVAAAFDEADAWPADGESSRRFAPGVVNHHGERGRGPQKRERPQGGGGAAWWNFMGYLLCYGFRARLRPNC